jgi:hypothetical protein
MALTEEKLLVSIEFNLNERTINVLWRERILRDGIEINGTNHRGAYPVDANGEVDPYVTTLLGDNLPNILGAACAEAQRRMDGLLQLVSQQASSIEVQAAELQHKTQLLAQASADITALQEYAQQLQVQLEAAQQPPALEAPAPLEEEVVDTPVEEVL